MKVFCPTCEEYRETRTVERKESYKVRGRKVIVPVTVTACVKCGEAVGGDEKDKEVLAAVYAEYRRQNDLLSPDQIQEIRRRYRLSQRSFAVLLGMSEATINRYEQGALQEPSHDTAIRACQDPAFVRGLLERRGNQLTEWQRKRTEDALAGQAVPESRWVDIAGNVNLLAMSNEVSVQTGFRRFDFRRFAAVVNWFCCDFGGVSRTVINKLLFYADFLNFKTATVSLTGSPYRRLQYGPVPSDYDFLLGQMEAQGLIVCREVGYPTGYTGFEYKPGSRAGAVEVTFTDHEKRVLARVAKAFKGMTAKAISDRSHRESAWRNTPDKQLISYQEASTLSLNL